LYLKTNYLTSTGNNFPAAFLAPSITTGNTNLVFSSGKKGKAQLSITTMNGTTIQTGSVYLRAGINTIPVNAAYLRPGIYIISVTGERGLVQAVRFTKL
jgi:hypothetical protein